MKELDLAKRWVFPFTFSFNTERFYMKYFVIADTHFGHENIIRYCIRPYHDVETMNDDIVRRWNSVVSKNDVVYVLGDFAFKREPVEKHARLLNGTKYLVKGNHGTYPNDFYRECGFKEVYDKPILLDFFLLSHQPLQLSETTPYFNYYGHIHNDEKYHDTATSKCVSVERVNYTPYCFMEKNAR